MSQEPEPEVVEYFGGPPTSSGVAAEGEVTFGDDGDALPASAEWMSTLAGPAKGWRSAALLSGKVVDGKRWVPNPLPGPSCRDPIPRLGLRSARS